VIDVDAGVDHRDDRISGARSGGDRFGALNPIERPLPRKQRIVRRTPIMASWRRFAGQLDGNVEFRVHNVGIAEKQGYRRLRIGLRAQRRNAHGRKGMRQRRIALHIAEAAPCVDWRMCA